MQQNKQLRLGALLSYASMFVGYAIQILYTPIMLRIIGQSQYGVYNLTNSIVTYLTLFSVGFAPAYVRFYMRHKVKDDQIAVSRMNGMFMGVFLALGVIATLAGVFMVHDTGALLGSNFSKSELSLAKRLMFLMVINLAISFPLIPFVSFIQANERFVFQNGLNLIRQLLNPIISLPLLLMGWGSIGMVTATTLISIVVSVAQFMYAVHVLDFRIRFDHIDFRELREVAVFSSFIFLNAITDQINWNADKFIIGRYYGAIPVAIYGVASQLNSYYLNFSTAISSVYIPRINKIVAERKKSMFLVLSNLFISIGRIQLIVMGAVLVELIAVGKQFIALWAGDGYQAAYPILVTLIIPVTIPLIQNTGIAMQQALNLHVFRSVVYFLIAIANIGLSIILVRPLGGFGTALATAISLVIGNGFLMNWYYARHVHLDIKRFWFTMLRNAGPIILSILYGFFSQRFLQLTGFLGFTFNAGLILICYLCLVYFMVLSPDEKRKIVLTVRFHHRKR